MRVFAFPCQRALRRTRVLAMLASGGILGLNLACQTQGDDLMQELKLRGGEEGLALIRIQSNMLEVLSFNDNDSLETSPNPRDVSNAWFSSDGKAVAWSINRWPGKELAACPSPVVVEVLNEPGSWQLPGNIINVQAMTVSSNGKQVAFDGTYKPEGTGFLATSKNRARWITGLQYVDLQTGMVKLVVPMPEGADRVTSIGLSPDGKQLVYDQKNGIYLYDVGSGSSRSIASGASPTWSPNGKWIAFRSENGDAETLNAATLETKSLFEQRKIRTSVHWSPDSRYVMVVEPLGMVSNLLHGRSPILGPSAQMIVERVEDHATTTVGLIDFKGDDDRGFYWIPDYPAFIRAATALPVIKGCDHQD
jgi:Tol biopolymer transport system component